MTNYKITTISSAMVREDGAVEDLSRRQDASLETMRSSENKGCRLESRIRDVRLSPLESIERNARSTYEHENDKREEEQAEEKAFYQRKIGAQRVGMA